MNDKQAYQITVTVDVSDHELSGVLIAAIEEALRHIHTERAFHWFCEGETVAFQVYQECEFNAIMAQYDQDVVLDLAYNKEV
jgi:hypothetical protein